MEEVYKNSLERVKLGLEIRCIELLDNIRQKYKGEELNELEGALHGITKDLSNMYEEIYLSRDHLLEYQYRMWKFGLKMIEEYDLRDKDLEELRKLIIFDPFKDLEEQFDGPPIRYWSEED